LENFLRNERKSVENVFQNGIPFSRPHSAWQIDPFGHTRGQAEMFSAFGFDSLYFARLDAEELDQRRKNSNLETVWKGNLDNLGANLFTGAFINGEYGPPD